MSSSPLVSVILPTYNRAHLLGWAVQSVLDQTFQDFELIVVDDCSTDNTPEVVARFGDPRIRCLRHEVNRGPMVARNTGIRASRGEYIACLDSDDEWLPEKLQRQIEVFNENPHNLDNLGVVVTGWHWVSAMNNKILSTDLPCHWGYIHPLFFGRTRFSRAKEPGHLAGLIRRTCLLDVGLYDETLPASEHWDLMMRLAAKYQFDVVTSPLAIFHRHSGPHVGTRENSVKAYEMLLSKYPEEFSRYPKFRSLLLRNISCYHLQNKAEGKARQAAWQAIRSNPYQVMAFGYFMLSLVDGRVYSVLTCVNKRLSRLLCTCPGPTVGMK